MYRDIATAVPKTMRKTRRRNGYVRQHVKTMQVVHSYIYILPQAVLLNYWEEHCEVKI